MVLWWWRWRKKQWQYDIEAGAALRISGDGGFAGWEVVTWFYAAMTAVTAWLERQGLGVPRNHVQRRLMVKRHLSHLYEDYQTLCSMSEDARYRQGYKMGGQERQLAKKLHDSILASIPWPDDA